MQSFIRVVGLSLWLTCTVLGLNLLQILSLAILPFSKRKTMQFNGWCAQIIWSLMQYVLEDWGAANITFSGHVLPFEENAIVICNHVSFTDIYLMHSLASRKRMLHACKYFAKKSLKWIPGFGWGIWLMGNIMINRNWASDKQKIKESFETMRSVKIPTWLISFPEGTRITPEKLQECQEFSKKKDLPVLNHVLIPRTKGFIATVHGLRNSHIKALYDVTIAYLHKPTNKLQIAPNMYRVHSAPLNTEYKFHVHVDRFELDQLPETEEGLADWLVERYIAKDKFLKRMQAQWLHNVKLVDQGQLTSLNFFNNKIKSRK